MHYFYHWKTRKFNVINPTSLLKCGSRMRELPSWSMVSGYLSQTVVFRHETKQQGKNTGHLQFIREWMGRRKDSCSRLSGSSPARASGTHFPIQLLNIFCVLHNDIVVYHFCVEHSEVFLRSTVLTKRDRKWRLIILIHSSFPLWGMENCFCHFSSATVL